MNVLHLGAGNLYGGVERFLATLARERGSCPGMAPGFGLASGGGRIARELAELHTPAAVFGPVRVSRPWQIRAARRRLAAQLRAARPGVAVCHAPWVLGLFGPAVRAAGVPLGFWMHDAVRPGARHWTERWARRCPPDLAIANSRFSADGLPALFGARAAGGMTQLVLPYPVSPPEPGDAAARERTRAELGASAGSVVILQVSRLERWKGAHVLLEALGVLRDTPDWVCWLAGGAQRPEEAAYLEELRARAAELGLGPGRVRFLGQREDVGRLLAAADVFCQANTGPEAFGIVFVEALGAGLPVVAGDAGGPREIVDAGCGRLVPPGDAGALAATLRELVGDAALRKTLGAGGPARARAWCEPAAVLGRLESALRDLSARAGGA